MSKPQNPHVRAIVEDFCAGFEGRPRPSRRCEDCDKGKGPNPFQRRIGGRHTEICPACAGKLCYALVRYHQGRKRDGLQGARRNLKAKRPLHVNGTWRCRNCEVQLHDYKVGDPPTCEECR